VLVQPHPRNHRRRVRPGRDDSGQSLVEFSLILTPLFLILLGIIQFGFIFNTFVTMTNAAREGGRTGTIYVYDRTRSKAQNDLNRNNAVKTSLLSSMNLLGKTAPNFTTGTWASSGQTSRSRTRCRPGWPTRTRGRVSESPSVLCTTRTW
jgi:Flp pilus assembly protein TadG